MRVLLVLAPLLALALPAAAWHCTTYSTTEPDLTVDASLAGQGTYYFDDLCQILNIIGICGDLGFMWVYEESNGLPGLQRGDEVVDDTCHGLVESDTILL